MLHRPTYPFHPHTLIIPYSLRRRLVHWVQGDGGPIGLEFIPSVKPWVDEYIHGTTKLGFWEMDPDEIEDGRKALEGRREYIRRIEPYRPLPDTVRFQVVHFQHLSDAVAFKLRWF